MNIYIKKWKAEDVDVEAIQYYGLKWSFFDRKKYKVFYLALVIANRCLIDVAITNNHKAFYEAYKDNWDVMADWQLFGDKNG